MPPIDLEEFGIDAHQERIVLERDRLEEIVAYSYYKGRFAPSDATPMNVCWKGAKLRLDASPEQIEAAKKGLRKYAAERLADLIGVIQRVSEDAITGEKSISLLTDFWYVNNDWGKRNDEV